MKKRTLTLGMAMLTAFSIWAQKSATLTFQQIKNLHEGDTLTLSWGAINKSMSPFITSFVPKEMPEISIPLNEPRLLVLGLKGQPDCLEILVAPDEKVNISGRLRNTNSLKAITGKLKVEGAAYQEAYTQLVNRYLTYTDSLDRDINKKHPEIVAILKQSQQTRNQQLVADLYNTPAGQFYLSKIRIYHEAKNTLLRNLVERERESFMGPLLLLKLVGRLDKGYQAFYDNFSETAKASYYGREVKEEVYPLSLRGELAPTVSVKNEEGADKMLSFANHGNRFLLLDFWASWCEPCRNEIPNLEELYRKYHDKGLDIISISTDRDMEEWKKSLRSLKEPWCNYLDENRQAISEYKVQYIPSIFILNDQGTIIAEKLKGKDLVDYISSLFGDSE